MKKGPIVSLLSCILIALLFNIGIYYFLGQGKALDFLTGYLIEWSLSIDNLFVFFLIFSYFKIDESQQNKILFWGVLGAQLMRAFFILTGVALLKHFEWVIYFFGALLIFSGIKLLLQQDKPKDLDQSKTFFFLKRFIPSKLSTFFIVLIIVEVADLIFAIDSIPAVLAVTKDPFIVYSSNIFAILGLRSLYFVLSPVFDMFHYLHYALGIILSFIGIKMLTDHVWHMSTLWALGFVLIVMTVFTLISIFINKRSKIRGL